VELVGLLVFALCLFVCFSETQIISVSSNRCMMNESEKVQKAAVCPVICLEVLRKTSKTVARKSDVRANIWPEHKERVRLGSVRLLPVR